MTTPRTGILLTNFGGPRTTAEIPRVLHDLFSDPDIFQTPLGPLGQQALAALIVYFRTPKVAKAYGRIGGKSPIYEITTQQAAALGPALAALDVDATFAIGMRYGEPSLESGIRQLLDSGCEKILTVPMYPHYSLSTTGSTLNAMGRLMSRLAPAIRWDYLPPFPTDAGYVAALADSVRGTLAAWDAAGLTQNRMLMFSAHGLPQEFVDMGDPYPKQVRATVAAVLKALDYHGRNALTFQSRVGPVEWLKPYTDASIVEWAEQGVDGIIAVPISFLADNLESLEEIDCEYRDLARECGIDAFMTVPCLNADPALIQVLAALIARRLAHPGPIPGMCTLPGRRPQPALIGLREWEAARRANEPFAPERLRVTAPYWKKVRLSPTRHPLVRLDGSAR